MKYSLKECKKMVNFACWSYGRLYAERVDVEAIVGHCFSRVKENKCNMYVSHVLNGKTYKEIGLGVGLSCTSVRSICMSIVHDIITLCEHPDYLETDITEMSAIYCLGLPNPIYRALTRAGFIIVGELTQMTEKDFEPIRGMGKKSVKVLNDTLSKYNLSLKDYEPESESARITLYAPKNRSSVGKAVDLGNMSYLKKDIDSATEERLKDFLLCCERESTIDELSQYFIRHVCNCVSEDDIVSAWEKYKTVNNIDIEKVMNSLTDNQL